MNKLQPLALVVLWAGVIFLLSSLNDSCFGVFGDKVLRKFGHLAEYFILAYALYRASSRSFKLGETGSCFVAAFVPLLYALSDEFHQLFVPSRCGAFRDVVIDMAGVACFFLFLEIKDRLLSSPLPDPRNSSS